jgi:hypothetical protein
LPLVPVFAGMEAKGDPGAFGQQVAAAVRDSRSSATAASTSSGFWFT